MDGSNSIHFSGESEDDDINEVDEYWKGRRIEICLNAIWQIVWCARNFLQNFAKKVVKSQHAMFSRRKGEAEDDSDDDINIVNEFWKEPKNVKKRQF